MDDPTSDAAEPDPDLAEALGGAMFAGLSQATLWLILAGKGIIDPHQAAVALDAQQAILERERGTADALHRAAIDFARVRLEVTIRQLRTLAPPPPPG